MQLTIPAKIETSGASWQSMAQNYYWFVDLNYDIFNTRLIQFNIPNAFTDTYLSQAERWLAEIPARHPQNNSRNSQFALSIAVWSWALNLHSITRKMIDDLKQIQYWTVRFWLFEQWTPKNKSVSLDFTNKKISSQTDSLNATDIFAVTWRWKGFIVNNGWNYFIVQAHTANTIRAIPCDANGNIIAWTITTATWTGVTAQVVWWKWAFFWVLNWENVTYMSVTWQLRTISSAGVMTAVWAEQTLYTHTSRSWTSVNFRGDSYIKNNTIYFWQQNFDSTPTYWVCAFWTIDMTNTTAFTGTLWRWYMDQPTVYPISLWFDWTNIVFSTATWTYTQSNWVDYVLAWTPYTSWIMLQTWSVSKQTTKNLSIGTFNSNLNFQIFWQNFMSYTTNLHTQIFPVYNMTWSNEMDDETALKKIIVKQVFSNVADWLSLTINWDVFWYDIIGDWSANVLIDSPLVLDTWTKEIDFSLTFLNTLSRQVKMWFWITSWTYASPVWANNTTWNATAWRTANANSSYIDLTIA